MQIYLQNWYDSFLNELPITGKLKIISPFVKDQVIQKVHENFNFTDFELITRFNLQDFALGVSSIDSLIFSIHHGALIFGIKQLHSKVYLFDKRAAIVTSANLTRGGMINNHECGVYLTDPDLINQLDNYFDYLKSIGPTPLTIEQCNEWKQRIERERQVINLFTKALPDFGASQCGVDNSKNYFVKFLGESSYRVPFNFSVREEVERALCHYACCFSKSPNQFRTDDIIYMGRMTTPNDFAIFGKAEAIQYDPRRDEASAAEIAERDWKEQWSKYIRVKNPVFIDSTMGDCVLLYDLIRNLDYQSFSSTQKRYLNGERAINPFQSLSQQAYIKLTHEAAAWLEPRFQQSLSRAGSIDKAFIQNLPQSGIII